jgi:hypothetical protein
MQNASRDFNRIHGVRSWILFTMDTGVSRRATKPGRIDLSATCAIDPASGRREPAGWTRRGGAEALLAQRRLRHHGAQHGVAGADQRLWNVVCNARLTRLVYAISAKTDAPVALCRSGASLNSPSVPSVRPRFIRQIERADQGPAPATRALEFRLQPAQFESDHTIASAERQPRSQRMQICKHPPAAQAKA